VASALDVAAYILARRGGMTAMKLQKLVYYSQAWSLVWDERPLFDDRIEAWANGPVCRTLYDQHRGQFRVAGVVGGDPERLDDDARETIDAVLSYYGDRSAQWLSDLSHLEAPWQKTRSDIADGAPCSREIGIAAMAEYYGSLPPEA
jgi:uncharacterized phage-associated protein